MCLEDVCISVAVIVGPIVYTWRVQTNSLPNTGWSQKELCELSSLVHTLQPMLANACARSTVTATKVKPAMKALKAVTSYC